jgi:DNA-binding beta-propeller fold protein YncE
MTQERIRLSECARRCARIAAGCLLAIAAGCAGRSGSSSDSPLKNAVVVGTTAPRLALAPDGRRVYAANNKLTVIDTANLSVLSTLDLEIPAMAVAAAPDGSRLYITSPASNQLKVYDTAGNQFGTPITMFEPDYRPAYAHLAVAPDSRTLYLVDPRALALAIVDLTTGTSRRVKSTISPYDVATSPDGRTVYVLGCRRGCAAGYLQRFDVASQKFTKELKVVGYPVRLLLSPDGQGAFIVSRDGPSVLAVDLAAWQLGGALHLPWSPTEAAISPDGAMIYISSVESGWVMAVDAATGDLRAQLSVPFVRDVLIAPDGQKLYVAMSSKVVALDARPQRQTP